METKPKRATQLLVALDGSPVAAEVMDRAVSLARTMDAELILLRTVGIPIEMPAEALRHSGEDLSSVLEGAARSDLARLGEAAEGRPRFRLRVAVGTAWQTICRVAHEEDVDLVVIGSHGYGPLDRVLGTTAARVVNRCDRDVLVVRPRALRAAEAS